MITERLADASEIEEATTSTDPDAGSKSAARAGSRSSWWLFAGGAVVAAFVASVVLSTGSSSVPVGAPGSMPGMSMAPGGGRLALTLRDLGNRTVRLPGGRPGVVVFAEGRVCDACVAAARAARDAMRSGASHAQLIVVMADSAAGRPDVAAFTRAVGSPQARYIADDRNGSLASLLGASLLSGVVVYDANGRVVARPAPDAPRDQIAAALRRAGT